MSYVFINDSCQTNVPLLQACIDGDLNYSKRLLESGFDPNIRDNRGRTGLHLAAARGNVEICRLLHKFGADLLATDYQGNTALHLCGHVDTIQFLVTNGLKIDIWNLVCLFQCIVKAQSVQKHVEENQHKRTKSFRSKLDFTDTHSDMSYVFINDSCQTNVPLLQACIDGDLNYSKRLLESGFDPNIRDNRGRTGLHLAAARGNVEICRLLHKFGADLLATDYQGNTALHLCGHVDTIQFLVTNGLKIDICAMESHSLLNPNLQHSEGVLSSFRTTWQEFVEDLGFWRVLLLIVVITLLSLGIAYYVSGVLPFVENQPELVH
ncbi:UNVERIFIED_CONTAM: hypothetical protein FKN15_035349 [Acipenser sinensis]